MQRRLRHRFDADRVHAARRRTLGERALAAADPGDLALEQQALIAARSRGVGSVAFGDIFLEDVRQYRETRMKELGMRAIFPLWGEPTLPLFRRFCAAGFRGVTSCIDPRKMPPSLLGRELTEDFLVALPDGVDPCGENGEFHTFVFAGPIFQKEVDWRPGRCVERSSFLFIDLVPVDPFPKGVT